VILHGVYLFAKIKWKTKFELTRRGEFLVRGKAILNEGEEILL
jgi:hypothetical protein